MKDIRYIGNTQKEIDEYPKSVRDRINFELVALQNNCPHAFDDFEFDEVEDDEDVEKKPKFPPAKKKSMRETIGRFAMQLTIKSSESYRVIYVAKFNEAIYILHTFKKKTEGVSKRDYRPAQTRYKELEQWRESEKIG